jgi:Phosphotransferase enzyme family
MTPLDSKGPRRDSGRRVMQEQRARAERVRAPEFLDRYVRPHLDRDAPVEGAAWRTRVIQLDGSGAATVQVALPGTAPVFAKLFPFGDGPAVHAKLTALRAGGLGEGQPYQVVEPLAWYDEERVLLCRQAPGHPASDLLGGDVEALAAATARAGHWLGRLHGSDLRIGRPQSLLVTGELTSLAKRLVKVAAQHPGYVREARAMLERLDALTLDTVDGVQAQSHGQFRPIHVFLSPDVVTVIDLDRSAPADPARDVAEFLHRLRLGVHTATGDIGRADRASSTFLAAYRESAGSGHLVNLRFHWARYVFHSLNAQLKTDESAGVDRDDADVEVLRSEFDRIVDGGAGA